MKRIMQIITRATLAAALFITAAPLATAHSDRNEKRPQSYAEAVIPWTREEFKRESMFRHPPGNVRAEDMRELFNNRVIVVDRGGKFSTVGATEHALKVIFIGRNGRYLFCGYDKNFNYFFEDDAWAPIKVKHAGTLQHMLDPATQIPFNPKRPGLSPLYDGTTGQIVWYRLRKTWHTWNVGHLQERLPRAVWTLCPDFPSAEELGVGVNEAQTAVTYDKLIAQDPGRRILRPDLITPDPTEVLE